MKRTLFRGRGQSTDNRQTIDRDNRQGQSTGTIDRDNRQGQSTGNKRGNLSWADTGRNPIGRWVTLQFGSLTSIAFRSLASVAFECLMRAALQSVGRSLCSAQAWRQSRTRA